MVPEDRGIRLEVEYAELLDQGLDGPARDEVSQIDRPRLAWKTRHWATHDQDPPQRLHRPYLS